MKKYFIPIIGAISSGKTTFLKGFLGIDILETGSTTTTKFVCLIKNSDKFLFYHVIPKKEENVITFTKDGEVSEGDRGLDFKIPRREEPDLAHLSAKPDGERLTATKQC